MTASSRHSKAFFCFLLSLCVLTPAFSQVHNADACHKKLSCGASSSPSKQDDDKAYLADMNAGISRASSGDYAGAIDEYTRAASHGSTSDLIYRDRGIAYQNSGDQEHAIADLSKAIEINPSSAINHAVRAAALAGEKRCVESFRDIQKARSLGSDVAQVNQIILGIRGTGCATDCQDGVYWFLQGSGAVVICVAAFFLVIYSLSLRRGSVDVGNALLGFDTATRISQPVTFWVTHVFVFTVAPTSAVAAGIFMVSVYNLARVNSCV